MDYLDTIQKYMDGKKYANKNISSSDNKIGYVTDTGVSKQYDSTDVYNATAGKNNCPSDFIKIVPTWSDLGFPVGSLMKSGQSCGNETKYVQASPPSNNFDWEYYIETYAPEDVTTKQQAIDHWNSTGKQSGFLPNANIMTSMSTLGKVGYIDADTQFHDVPVTAKSSYKSFPNISNVTGVTMTDCSSAIPSLKYGEAIVLTHQTKTGYINTSSVLQFGTNNTKMFLHPPPGDDQMGKAVKYGDLVGISSSSSSYTTQCGWWGCKVAYVNTSTNQMEFGPGGDFTTTFEINPPKGSNYTLGSEIKYGFPFTFMTVSTTNLGSLTKGDSMNCTSGTQPSGMNSDVYRYSGNNKYQYYPSPSIASSWKSDWGDNIVDVDCSTYKYNGAATMLNAANLADTATVTCKSGQELTNGAGQGAVYRYVGDNVLRHYSNPTIATSWDIDWSTCSQPIDCRTYMAGEPMQSKTEEATPVDNSSKFAYVSNNVVKFGSWNESKNKNEFSVEYTATIPTCDIGKLKELCTDDCVGFIHSPDTNTWQKITPTSEYKITSTVQDVYLKEYDLNLKDTSCTKSDVQFIDPTIFSNYPQGDDFNTDGTNQCKVLDSIQVPTYNANNTTTTTTYLPSTGTIQDQYEETTDIMKSKTDEYQTLLRQLQRVPSTTTLEQQYKDMSIFDKQHKLQLVLWTILSASILAIVLIRK